MLTNPPAPYKVHQTYPFVTGSSVNNKYMNLNKSLTKADWLRNSTIRIKALYSGFYVERALLVLCILAYSRKMHKQNKIHLSLYA